MKPISVDLRQRVLAAVEQGKLRCVEVAERFCVCESWVRRLVRRVHETGSIEPLPHGGGRRPKLNDQHLARLRQLVSEDSDASLDELRIRLGEPVSEMTICRALKRLNLPLKKSRSGPANRIVRTLPEIVANTRSRSGKSTRVGRSTSTKPG